MDIERIFKTITQKYSSANEERKLSKGTTELVRTPLPDFQLRVNPDPNTDFTTTTDQARFLQNSARQLVFTYLLKNQVSEEIDLLKEQFVVYAETNPGFRGVWTDNINENWTVLITPVKEIEVKENLLNQKLGELIHAVVNEKYTIETSLDGLILTMDDKVLRVQDIITLIRQTLIDANIDPIQVDAMLNIKSQISVDEKRWDSLSEKELVQPRDENDYTRIKAWRLNVDVERFDFIE